MVLGLVILLVRRNVPESPRWLFIHGHVYPRARARGRAAGRQRRVRRPVQELRLEIRAATADLTHQVSRVPRTAELAEYPHVSPQAVEEARQADQALAVPSLDAPIGADSYSARLADLMGAEDPRLEQAVDRNRSGGTGQSSPGRQQQRLLLRMMMMMMRFYGDMTQSQIGEQLGISQTHVSRLLSSALDFLRNRLDPPGAGPARPARPAHSAQPSPS